MSELPTDAVEAAAKAFCDKYAHDEELVGKAWREISRSDAETALAAALPFLERALRDKIADEVKRLRDQYDPRYHQLAINANHMAEVTVREGFVRVARGGEATE